MNEQFKNVAIASTFQLYKNSASPSLAGASDDVVFCIFRSAEGLGMAVNIVDLKTALDAVDTETWVESPSEPDASSHS